MDVCNSKESKKKLHYKFERLPDVELISRKERVFALHSTD